MDLAIFSKMHRPLPDIDFIGSCAELARRGLLPDEGLRRFVGYRTDKIGARVFNSAGATQRWVSNDGQAAWSLCPALDHLVLPADRRLRLCGAERV